MYAQMNLEPGTKIHGIGDGRDANVTEVASGVTGRDIHAAAERDGKMGKVAADAYAFAKRLKRGAIGATCR